MSVATARSATSPERVADGPNPTTATELVVLAAVTIVALIARFWAFAATGLGHFDEGVYVISAVGVADPEQGLFTNQINFSPPFYFGAVGVALRLFGGDPDRIAVLVNILLGTGTVLATWWVARSWFGPRAAAVAAAMLALNQFHILMSRVALTDIAFAFWFVLALGALTLAIDRRDFRLAALAGVLTGLTWNTKYHGWFVLLITAAALVPTVWRTRGTGQWRRAAGVWGVAAGIAALLYLPWAAYIRTQSTGGYGEIISYYATMLRIDWLGNLLRQLRQQAYLEGALSRAAPLAALAAGLLVRAAPTAARRIAVLAVGLGVGGLLAGQWAVAALLAVAAVPMLLREFASYRARVLLCWLGLWVVAAPVYHPYARLLLPFTIVTFVLAGAVIDRLIGTAHGEDGAARRGRSRWAGFALAGAAGTAALALVLRDDVGDPWFPSRDLAEAARVIDEAVPPGPTIHVIGEPPLVHYLRERGRELPTRVELEALDTLSETAYLVTGVYTRRAPLLRDAVAALDDRLTQVAVLSFVPNDLRLLDGFRPHQARRYRLDPDSTFDLTLYRLAPAAER